MGEAGLRGNGVDCEVGFAEEAFDFADRIALMEDGRIESVESGPHHAADHRD